jgi:NADPH:quinone reductase-like Zn-dependent oxidoreductase
MPSLVITSPSTPPSIRLDPQDGCFIPGLEGAGTVEAVAVAEGFAVSDAPIPFDYIEGRDALEASAKELFEVVASGKVRINVKQRFALKDAADAHKALERAPPPAPSS